MWRSSAIFCFILMAALPALAGDVIRADESVVTGDILSFDGKAVQVRRQYGTDPIITVPIGDVGRVIFHEMRGDGRVHEADRPRGDVVLPDVWELKLSNGDFVNGKLEAWTENELQLGLRL